MLLRSTMCRSELSGPQFEVISYSSRGDLTGTRTQGTQSHPNGAGQGGRAGGWHGGLGATELFRGDGSQVLIKL